MYYNCLRFKSMIGSDIYQETLAKALTKHFGARLLIVDSLSLPGGTPSKEVDSAKESSKPERPSVLAKRSDRVKFVGNFPSAVSSIQNHPSRVMLLGGRAPEYLAHDPLVALVIKLFSVAKDHKFIAFPPVKPAPVASGAHWVEPDTSNSGGW
ncbi:hypothetical protein DS421_20g693450 [Arachis hypogaea]|nr:hypothetical protein DS421_20g693450 [Arachis hypogaea]